MCVWVYEHLQFMVTAAIFGKLPNLTAESFTGVLCRFLWVLVSIVLSLSLTVIAETVEYLLVSYSQTHTQSGIANWKYNIGKPLLLANFHSYACIPMFVFPVFVLSHPVSDQNPSDTVRWPLRTHRNLIFLQTRQLGPWNLIHSWILHRARQWHSE